MCYLSTASAILFQCATMTGSFALEQNLHNATLRDLSHRESETLVK